MSATFTVRGLDRVVKACAKGFPDAFQFYGEDVADELVTQARKEAPRKSGRLADSNYVKVTGGKTKRALTLTNDVPYADFVNRGTRPHTILPRFAQALYWPGAAHPVARVHHPGTRANPFLERAVTVAQGAITGSIAESYRANAAKEFED